MCVCPLGHGIRAQLWNILGDAPGWLQTETHRQKQCLVFDSHFRVILPLSATSTRYTDISYHCVIPVMNLQCFLAVRLWVSDWCPSSFHVTFCTTGLGSHWPLVEPRETAFNRNMLHLKGRCTYFTQQVHFTRQAECYLNCENSCIVSVGASTCLRG